MVFKKIFNPGIILLIFIFTGFLHTAFAGESDREIKDRCLSYLNKKYNRAFRIEHFKKFFHGGHWKYQLDIKAAPMDNSSGAFEIRYNYNEEKVDWDQYKKGYWEKQAAEDAAGILNKYYKINRIKAVLRANNSLAFNTSQLEFYTHYSQLIKNISNPRLKLEVDLEMIGPADVKTAGFLKLAEYFSRKNFEKIEYSIKLNGNGKNIGGMQILKFKVKKNQGLPSVSELKSMIYRKGSDNYLSENRTLFTQAEKLQNSGYSEKALIIYLRIVKSNREHRFREYIISESAYVVESAFRAAEIYREGADIKKSIALHRAVLKKMEFTEVPLKLNRLVKESRRIIDLLEKSK